MTTNLLLVAGLAAWTLTGLAVAQTRPLGSDEDVFALNRRLGRGINLGNALDAPREGEWGVTLDESYFKLIAEAGFNSVRIPVRWSAHASDQAPYTIDQQFLARVTWAVDHALARDLAVVLNFHHYQGMDRAPLQNVERLKGMWRQVADQFRSYPQTLLFELLNEPHDRLDAATWNPIIAQLLSIIRESNPTRVVIIPPASGGLINGLNALQLPQDRRIIATVHYYNPFQFTHQGASWVGEQSRPWLGMTWMGTDQQRLAVQRDLDIAAGWARQNNVPIYLGEFGAYERADMDSRARWTRFVREQAEQRNMSWAYWEFCAGFGAYDREARQWRAPLLEALTGK
jgi:endoglucanase